MVEIKKKRLSIISPFFFISYSTSSGSMLSIWPS